MLPAPRAPVTSGVSGSPQGPHRRPAPGFLSRRPPGGREPEGGQMSVKEHARGRGRGPHLPAPATRGHLGLPGPLTLEPPGLTQAACAAGLSIGPLPLDPTIKRPRWECFNPLWAAVVPYRQAQASPGQPSFCAPFGSGGYCRKAAPVLGVFGDLPGAHGPRRPSPAQKGLTGAPHAPSHGSRLPARVQGSFPPRALLSACSTSLPGVGCRGQWVWHPPLAEMELGLGGDWARSPA